MKTPLVCFMPLLLIRRDSIYFIFVDMRKACSRDVKQKSIIPLCHPVRPEDVD